MTHPKDNDPPAVRTASKFAALLWAIVMVPLATTLLAVASSDRGRVFGCAWLLLGLLPLAAVFTRATGARHWRLLLIVCVGGAVGCVVALALRTPTGKRPGARVTHEHARGVMGFQRLALGNLLPENDQLQLIFTVVPLFDRLFTLEKSKQLKAETASIYHELEGDGDFRALGSSMTRSYLDLIGIHTPAEHAFVYVPPSIDRKAPAPLVIFYHGTGGNFKGYLWVLSRLADRAGFVLVAPSNGMGWWRGIEAMTSQDFAIAAASKRALIDTRRVSAVGLSNGAIAVSQLAALRGGQLSSIIFLSPIFDEAELESAAFAEQCRRRPVLVIAGEKDERAPIEYVKRGAATMARQGARVRLETMGDANHFLMFTHRPQLENILEEWLVAADRLPPAPENL